MDARDLPLVKAVRKQALARFGDLAAAADAADVGRLAPEHLCQYLIVRLMTRRHHNNVVVRRKLHPRGNIRKAAADDLVGARIALRLCKRRTVVVHRHAKADRCKHRHKRAADVSAAENVSLPRALERLDIKTVAP